MPLRSTKELSNDQQRAGTQRHAALPTALINILKSCRTGDRGLWQGFPATGPMHPLAPAPPGLGCPPAGLRPGVGCQRCQRILTSSIQGNQKLLPSSSGTGMETVCWATQLSCTALPPYLRLSQYTWMEKGCWQMRGRTCARAAFRGGWCTAKSRGSGSSWGKARGALAHAWHVAKLPGEKERGAQPWRVEVTCSWF